MHIPKTAGISLAEGLFGENCFPGHIPIVKYQMLFSLKEFQKFYKFSFVRNPWDRFVSAYTFLMDGGISDYDKKFAATTLSQFHGFEDFVRHWCTTENVFSIPHFTPQFAFICNPNGMVMLDYVGRFEALNDSYNVICNKLGIKSSLPHKNFTRRRKSDYRSYYSSLSAEIVGRLYIHDINLFGYSFEDGGHN